MGRRILERNLITGEIIRYPEYYRKQGVEAERLRTKKEIDLVKEQGSWKAFLEFAKKIEKESEKDE